MAAVVPAVAAIVAGSAASAIVGGGILGAVIGGIASIGVSYLAREIIQPERPSLRTIPAAPPRVYTPPPAPAPRTVAPARPYQAAYRAPYQTASAQPSPAPGLAGGGLTQMVRQPVTAHRVIYGEVRVGGPLVFLRSRAPEGSDKLDLLHLAVVLAAHEVEAIGDLIVNDQVVALDTDGKATADPYRRDGTVYLQLWKHLGAADQAADPVLAANSGGRWTNAHRLRGRAWLHAQLRYDDKAFPSGIPNLSALVKGRKLYDPRTETTVWSDNPALCILDYLRASFGLAASLDEIDLPSFIAAANICDETVDRPGGSEKRYTCNGVLDLAHKPIEVLPPLLTSCAGRLTYTTGQWRLFAGAYLPPMATLTEAQARDTLTIKPKRSRRELINTVRGTFISPMHSYQPTDYPPVRRQVYLDEDGGEEVSENLDLPFTRSPYMAQRIARIALETRRSQMTVQFPANLAGLSLVAGETVALSLARLGLVEVPMSVSTWRMTEEMGVDLTLHQESADIYAIALADLTEMPATPALSLPGNQDIPPARPTDLVAAVSGSAVRLVWSMTAEPDFSHFEVYEHGEDTTDPGATATRIAEPFAATLFRSGLAPGDSRHWWVRAVDRHGNRSPFAGPASASIPAVGVALILE